MKRRIALVVVLVAGLCTAALAQSGTRIVQHRSTDFVEGELDGLAIDASGALVVAPVSQTRFFTPALYIWSLALDNDGRVLAGTGDDGSVMRESGDVFEEIARFPDELVMDVAADGDEVLAATGPEGRIHRIGPDGSTTIVVDREETTAWTLAPTRDGKSWLAGFGPEAMLVRFDSDEPGEGEVRQTFAASVVRRLVRDGDRLWLVTQGPSLVWVSDGDADRAERLRHDAGENEIPDAVADGEGGLWFLVLDAGDPEQMEPPSSRLMHLPAAGSAELVWAGELALMSIARAPDRALLVGEIGASRIHRITPEGRIGLWRDFGSGDASALLSDGGVTWVGSSNLGDLFRLAPPRNDRGIFTSPAVPTPAAERWGRLWVEADEGRVRYSVRSGVRSEPDASWTGWSDWADPGDGFDVGLGDYLQYRLEVQGARVTAVGLSWARRNHAPRIGAVRIERTEPGDWSDPGSNGHSGNGGSRAVSVVRGAVRVRVDAIDPDGDPLRCTIAVRETGSSQWYPLGGDETSLQAEWDTTQFADGIYEARAETSDTLARADGASASLQSVPVTVDNTPPRLRDARVEEEQLRIRIEDRGSRLVRVEIRWSGEEDFRRLEPVDGVVDGPEEEFRVERPADGRAVWIRARDAAGNENVFSPRIGD